MPAAVKSAFSDVWLVRIWLFWSLPCRLRETVQVLGSPAPTVTVFTPVSS